MGHILLEQRHQSALHMLGCALKLGNDPDVWDGLPFVLMVRLTNDERIRLLEAMMFAVEDDQVALTLDHHQKRAGSPLPVLSEVVDDARWWADFASPPELKAWLAACFVRLPYRDQQAFLETAMRRVAA